MLCLAAATQDLQVCRCPSFEVLCLAYATRGLVCPHRLQVFDSLKVPSLSLRHGYAGRIVHRSARSGTLSASSTEARHALCRSVAQRQTSSGTRGKSTAATPASRRSTLCRSAGACRLVLAERQPQRYGVGGRAAVAKGVAALCRSVVRVGTRFGSTATEAARRSVSGVSTRYNCRGSDRALPRRSRHEQGRHALRHGRGRLPCEHVAVLREGGNVLRALCEGRGVRRPDIGRAHSRDRRDVAGVGV